MSSLSSDRSFHALGLRRTLSGILLGTSPELSEYWLNSRGRTLSMLRRMMLLSLIFSGLTGVVGCGDDSNDTPPAPVIIFPDQMVAEECVVAADECPNACVSGT